MKLKEIAQNSAVWGSDVIAAAMPEQGFPYVVLNPGASFRGLHDSIVNFLGNAQPKMLLVLHEEHAVAIAHGFALVTDEPLAAIVHSNVGLMHATMGIFDAWCARQPVVVFGATGPVDAAKRRPWIEWIHTAADQGALVRGYTKWDDQPASPAAAVEAVRRATIIAKTRPRGPVYINLDVSLQEDELAEWPQLHEAGRFALPRDASVAEEDISLAAQWLNGARNIVVLAGRMSRQEQHWRERIELIEKLGAATLIGNSPAAFPTKNPHFAGEVTYRLTADQTALLRGADVILSLDWIDLGGTLSQVFSPGSSRGSSIIHCSIDHHVHNGWSMDYQMLPISDLHLAATPEAVTAVLLKHVAARTASGGALKALVEITPRSTQGEIGIQDLAATFLSVTKNMDISLIGRPMGWPLGVTPIDHPHDWLGEGHGGGIGAGPGIAVGAALALRDLGSSRLPVLITGDGDFTMGCSAIWTAATERIPLLVIVANNRSYFNDELHQELVAGTRRRPKVNAWIGQRIDDPAPDVAIIAKGFGIQSAGPIERIEDLADAISEAIEAVRLGRTYVLDVIVKREYAHKPMDKTKSDKV